MDELVTLEEADGGSDILLVVPKATVLQVRRPQQTCSRAGGAKDSFARVLLTLCSLCQLDTSLGVVKALLSRNSASE